MPAVPAREVRRLVKEREGDQMLRSAVSRSAGRLAQAAARAKLTAAYDQFMAEGNPAKKSEVGGDLI